MTIQAAQLNDFAIEFKTVVGELGFAEANSAGNFVDHLRPAQQANVHRIQIWAGKIPQFDGTKLVEMNAVNHWIGGGAERRNALRTFGEYPVAIAEIDLEGQRVFGRSAILNKAIHIEPRMSRQHVFRLGENILDKGGGNNP